MEADGQAGDGHYPRAKLTGRQAASQPARRISLDDSCWDCMSRCCRSEGVSREGRARFNLDLAFVAFADVTRTRGQEGRADAENRKRREEAKSGIGESAHYFPAVFLPSGHGQLSRVNTTHQREKIRSLDLWSGDTVRQSILSLHFLSRGMFAFD